MANISKLVPIADQERIKVAYLALPHDHLKYSAECFVSRIDFRIYTEWCMSFTEGSSFPSLHSRYDGHAFTKFIDDETHYALKRAGHKTTKIPVNKELFGDYSLNEQFSDLTSEEYQHVRGEVLVGLTKRAIEFFTQDEAKTLGRMNLRTSLEEYINQ